MKPEGAKGGIYRTRRFSEGHPDLSTRHLDWYKTNLEAMPDEGERLQRVLQYLGRVVDLDPPKRIVVVGCGPRPTLMKGLIERGYDVVGVEPLPTFVTAARVYLDGGGEVLQGSAESLPVRDATCDVVLCESVLEHVDSPRLSLDEMYRALRPGRIAFITTTNRLRFSLAGNAGEYNVRFFNWLPRIVRESYAFRHLHYDPRLANYSPRPAVHWFTFAELCRLGRDSGFAQFYSPLDLLETNDPVIAGKWWRRLLLPFLQRNPWLRGLALTQIGHGIVMFKRAVPSDELG